MATIIRKTLLHVENTLIEGGREAARPLTLIAAMAVVVWRMVPPRTWMMPRIVAPAADSRAGTGEAPPRGGFDGASH